MAVAPSGAAESPAGGGEHPATLNRSASPGITAITGPEPVARQGGTIALRLARARQASMRPHFGRARTASRARAYLIRVNSSARARRAVNVTRILVALARRNADRAEAAMRA
jgi:hypothetical protein